MSVKRGKIFWCIFIEVLFLLFAAMRLIAETNALPHWSPTPVQAELMGLTADQSNVVAYAEALAASNVVVLSGPPVPMETDPSTNPPPPKMSMDIYYGLPGYIKDEAEGDIREKIDQERRPRVQALWYYSLTDTNAYRVIGEWEPYQLQGFYRMRVVK